VRLSADGAIELDGICSIEDADTLQKHMLSIPRALVDWRTCTYAHTAVIQILMAFKPVLRGPPAGDSLRLLIDPLIKALPS
jgi:hypothetical protein